MPYPAIPSRRIPYDIDGTVLGVSDADINSSNFPASILSITPTDYTTWNLTPLNDENFANLSPQMYHYATRALIFFFTELTELTHISIGHNRDPGLWDIRASVDTTNGVDGTWETPTWTMNQATTIHALRTNVVPISFSGPIKVLKISFVPGYMKYIRLNHIHLYGMKYATQTPDDLLFVDASTGAELTALTDWGDRPEGTTVFKQVKVKNASTTKTANNINLQLNHTDFVMSWNAGGPWTTVLDITSLGVGAESATIYLKNEIAPPNIPLGPKMGARIIATVGSWT